MASSSLGQVKELPSQVSAWSQVPAAARQVKPLGCLLSAGHAAALPVHFSAMSQEPAEARHTVDEDLNVLAGHVFDEPSQVSARSHPPATARQVLPLDSTASPGQAVVTPLQVSARSQPPLAARQVAPFLTGPQVPSLAAPAATPWVLGAASTLGMVNRVVFGPVANGGVAGLKDAKGRGLLVLGGLAAAVLLLGLWPAPLVEVMDVTIQNLVQQIAVSKIGAAAEPVAAVQF